MKTIRYFIFVMRTPKEVYGGLFGKLKHFRKAYLIRKEVRHGQPRL